MSEVADKTPTRSRSSRSPESKASKAGPGRRLPAPAGAWIDRSKPVEFTFEGRRVSGYSGDTIASALLADGVSMLGRSFKYHRPRAPVTMAGQDVNSFVQLPDEPSARADARTIEAGMDVRGQNYSGSLAHDRLGLINPLGRFLPVGFYYKTFYKPKGAWRYWAPIIRKVAGLGRVNQNARPGYSDKAYRFADVAVIGGGPAGMSAAVQAADAGCEVLLIDENRRLGGSLNYARFDAEGQRGRSLAAELVDTVVAHPRIEVLADSACTGWFTDNWLAITQQRRMLKLRARSVVMATGSIEQPIVFRNNDLPGVMQTSGVQRLLHLYGVCPGKRAVVVTTNDDGYGCALDLLDAGAEVTAVVDMRDQPQSTELSDAVRDRGVRIVPGHAPYEAQSGKNRVAGVVIDKITGKGKVAGTTENLDCDLLVMGAGYSPAAQLACHSGGRLVYSEANAMLQLGELPSRCAVAAGSVNSTFNLDAVVQDGRHAGWAAAGQAGHEDAAEPEAPKDKGEGRQNYSWPIFPHPKGKDFVDFDEDLTVKDILGAIAEGYADLELVKRYSTVVMGPSQGRHSALANLRLTYDATNRQLEGATLTTQRPPFQPEKIAQLAGRSFQPQRLTAMHQRHVEAGAQMMPAGLWLRPAYYGSPENRDQSISAEARAVRENVGMIDVSTLGSIEIQGPDAVEFISRIYTFGYRKQPIDRSRYLLATDAMGTISDDGVACRISEEHFYVTATTGGADAFYQSMIRYRTEWQLDVDITNFSSAFAAVNVAGPNARKVMEKVTEGVDLSAESFPAIEARLGKVAGIPARLIRVGFVGELGYEVHVPSSQGEALWDALVEAGAEYDMRLFGVEAQRILRLEKGHIIVGQDTDGLTFPHEVNMEWAIAGKKPFFVGKRAIEARAAQPLTRKQVGFTLPLSSTVPEECNLTVRGDEITGRVTSAARSHACNNIVGLAFVAPDQTEPGQQFDIRLTSGELVQATVVKMPFYDPDNKRQEM